MQSFKIPAIITTFITLVLIGINHFLNGSFWEHWQLESSMLAGCFCEHNYMDRFIRQPFNTWSNLVYLFFGAAILYQAFAGENSDQNYLSRQPVIGTGYGILLCILFMGSFLFHASLTQFFGITDMIGTYGIPLYLSMIGISRILVYHDILKEKPAALLCVISSFAIGFALAIKWMIIIDMIITFSTLLAVGGFTAIYLYTRKDLSYNRTFIFLVFIMMAASCVIWILDHRHIICDPYSNFQGHSFWHVLNGAAAYFMYEFFYSEKVN